MSEKLERCAARVPDQIGWAYVSCSKRAKFDHDGKRWCHVHYPPNAEKRREEARQRDAAKRATEDAWRHFECREQAAALEAENAKLRETNKALNRRCQAAESAVAEKLAASSGSLGRALANAGYGMVQRENAKLRAALEEMVPLLSCRCGEAWTSRDHHASDCYQWVADIGIDALADEPSAEGRE